MQLHLAPMKNFTCWAFRASIPSVTDSYTEMINLHDLLKNKEQAWNGLDTYYIQNQRQWIQILTHDEKEISLLPNRLKQFFNDFKDKSHIYGVNINVGCPDNAIIAAGDGAALIKRTKRLIDLIKAFLGEPESHCLHISVKFRLGLNAKEMLFKKFLDFLENVRTIEDPRLAPPIFHFKHARESSQEEPHWEFIEDLIDTNVPIIINGNIDSPQYINKIQEKVSKKSKESWKKSILGVMMGRAALKNPYCFSQFDLFDKNSELIPWEEILKQNLRIHPPQERYVSNFSKLYPNIFKN